MKKAALITLLISLFLLPSLALAQEIGEINMVGEWQGVCHMYREDNGFLMNQKTTYVIKEQKGQIFHGEKKWTGRDGKAQSEAVAGTVGYMGSIYMAEKNDGIALGRMLASGVVELHYLEPGRVMVVKLTKLH